MSNRRWANQHPRADADEAASLTTPLRQARREELFAHWARRYIWWKSAPDALRYPNRIIAQVMNIGDYDDVVALIEVFGVEALREVVRQAEPGEFNARSWAYWHYRLGLVPLLADAPIPPLPARSFP